VETNSLMLRPELPCASKVAYSSAAAAAAVGERASAERSVSLWTYHCNHCFNWHLTRQDQGSDFAVSAPHTAPDDFVDLPGEGPFWWRIEQLSIEDAFDTLKLLAKNLAAEQGRLSAKSGNVTSRQKLLSDLSKKVAIEMHFKNQSVQRKEFLYAVRTILGEEAETELRIEVAKVVHSQTYHADGGCESMIRYVDELESRVEGRVLIKQAGGDLWVFPCAYCKGWHTTTKQRSDHWHVRTKVDSADNYVDLLGDRWFWHRIIDMPQVDLERQLKEAIHRVKNQLDQSEGLEHCRLVALSRMLKLEIMSYTTKRTDLPTRKVLVSMYGEEAFERIKSLLSS
jgi:hypothetical protein